MRKKQEVTTVDYKVKRFERVVPGVGTLLAAARRPLYSSSFYLLGRAGINSGAGLVFWVLAARLVKTSDVGLAAALISAVMLLGWITSLGLEIAIVKYLPGASSASADLTNSYLTVSNLAGLVGGVVCLVVLPWWLPSLVFIREYPLAIAVFLATVVGGGISAFVDYALVVLRRSDLVFARTALQAVAKLVLLASIANERTGALGIFVAFGLSTVISAVNCLWLFLPLAMPGYRPRLVIGRHITGEAAQFSIANYICSSLQNATQGLIPLITLSVLGSTATAYSYVGWRAAAPLLSISDAVATSLYAEGSHRDETLSSNVVRSLKLTALLLLPAVAVAFLAASKVLLIFGGHYSQEATLILRVLVLSAIPGAIVELYLSIARVQHRLVAMLVMPTVIAIGTLGLGYVALRPLGILGPAVTWTASLTVVVLVVLPGILKLVRARPTARARLGSMQREAPSTGTAE